MNFNEEIEWLVTGEIINLQTNEIENYDYWINAFSKKEALQNSIYKMEQKGYKVKRANAVINYIWERDKKDYLKNKYRK